jgi:lipoprotein-releasing system ATP-binding protein
MSSVLGCTNLCKSFNEGSAELQILRDINFSIAAGERIAIMGSSGSGKSTLLHLLGGLDEPTSGDVTITDLQVSRLNPV